MTSALKSVKQERAALERDRVVMGSMIQDGVVAEAVESFDTDFFEGVSGEEVAELIDRIPESDEEDEQVDRILNADEDLDIDDVLGVEHDDAEIVIDDED